MARRLGFIQKLSAFLRGLPQRNVLCLLGDANTQLTTRSGVVGHGIPSTPGPQRDVQDLLDLLQAFSLTAVNMVLHLEVLSAILPPSTNPK